jgi:hypothetical protein
VTGELVSVSASATGHPLPFSWEWRRGSTPLITNTVNQRFDFFSFTNINSVGSTQQYRVIARSLSGFANATFNILTLTDSDGDRLPDAWESEFFGSTNGAVAVFDSDGDTMSNLQEYNAGTDPTNALSFLRVDISAGNGQAVVSFGAISNRTYTIEFSDEVASSIWWKLADVFARTNSRVETITDPLWNTNRFYRAVTPRR